MKPFDCENLDLLEEDGEDVPSTKQFKSSSNNSAHVKFNEILTGTEVIITIKSLGPYSLGSFDRDLQLRHSD